MEVLKSFALPYSVVIIVVGLLLTIHLSFPQRRLFLAIRTISGLRDPAENKNHLAPIQAASLSFAGFPGALIGGLLAFYIAGPGVLLYIWFAAILSMSIHTTSTVLSIKTRIPGDENQLLGGPAQYIDALLKTKSLSLAFALIFIFTALFQGSALSIAVTGKVLHTAEIPGNPLLWSMILGFLTMLISLSGLHHAGRIGRNLTVAGSGLLVLTTVMLFFDSDIEKGFFQTALSETFSGSFWNHLIGAGIFLALAEIDTGRKATLAAAIRTEQTASQGLAAGLSPLLSAFFATVAGIFLFIADQQSFSPSDILIGQSGIYYSVVLVAIVLLCLNSLIGWLIAGFQVARYFGGRSSAFAFQGLFFFATITTGIFLNENPEQLGIRIMMASAIVTMIPGLFHITVLYMLRRTARFELAQLKLSEERKFHWKRDSYLLALSLLPKNLISRFFGYISIIRFPRTMMARINLTFAKTFKIRLDEAEKHIMDYPTLNSFFTRALKPGVRTIEKHKKAIVSPVDGRISEFGDIEQDTMIQAKGMHYSLDDLIPWQEYANRLQSGSYMVIYLSPQDYHRIHSPVDGRIMAYAYDPGTLFPVNARAVSGVHSLFARNERLTTFIETRQGLIGLVKVGATNVGKISLSYDRIKTNGWKRHKDHHSYSSPLTVEKGEELAMFEMGSTVILLFEKDTMFFEPQILSGDRTQLGKKIAEFLRPGRTGR